MLENFNSRIGLVRLLEQTQSNFGVYVKATVIAMVTFVCLAPLGWSFWSYVFTTCLHDLWPSLGTDAGVVGEGLCILALVVTTALYFLILSQLLRKVKIRTEKIKSCVVVSGTFTLVIAIFLLSLLLRSLPLAW